MKSQTKKSQSSIQRNTEKASGKFLKSSSDNPSSPLTPHIKRQQSPLQRSKSYIRSFIIKKQPEYSKSFEQQQNTTIDDTADNQNNNSSNISYVDITYNTLDCWLYEKKNIEFLWNVYYKNIIELNEIVQRLLQSLRKDNYHQQCFFNEFKKHLIECKAEENLYFWIAVQWYRCISFDTAITTSTTTVFETTLPIEIANEIFKTFLIPNSINSVNVSHENFKDIESLLTINETPLTLFDSIEREIIEHLTFIYMLKFNKK